MTLAWRGRQSTSYRACAVTCSPSSLVPRRPTGASCCARLRCDAKNGPSGSTSMRSPSDLATRGIGFWATTHDGRTSDACCVMRITAARSVARGGVASEGHADEVGAGTGRSPSSPGDVDGGAPGSSRASPASPTRRPPFEFGEHLKHGGAVPPPSRQRQRHPRREQQRRQGAGAALHHSGPTRRWAPLA